MLIRRYALATGFSFRMNIGIAARTTGGRNHRHCPSLRCRCFHTRVDIWRADHASRPGRACRSVTLMNHQVRRRAFGRTQRLRQRQPNAGNCERQHKCYACNDRLHVGITNGTTARSCFSALSSSTDQGGRKRLIAAAAPAWRTTHTLRERRSEHRTAGQS
jgi:hypothetical protein